LINKLQITFVGVLFNFCLGDWAMAEEEKQLKSDNATASDSSSPVASYFNKDIAVRVQNDGEQIVVDADFLAPVAPEQAWAVLTDFENISGFNPDILSSKVTDRTGNNLRVLQKSVTKYGFLSFAFESLREINLVPFKKIQERMVSGNMRKMEETTQLTLEGKGTRVTYHGIFIPNVRIPFIGGHVLIKREARAQFEKVLNEMLRRNQVRVARQ
jgi:hypothetical protein